TIFEDTTIEFNQPILINTIFEDETFEVIKPINIRTNFNCSTSITKEKRLQRDSSS
ncbi:MAG: hypothetical protein H8E13_00540, partial [Actinobacteria bacterium]|nr:hypothetical protein [Actinomycetota bacterium]